MPCYQKGSEFKRNCFKSAYFSVKIRTMAAWIFKKWNAVQWSRAVGLFMLLLQLDAAFAQCNPSDTLGVFEISRLDQQPAFPGGEAELLKFISRAPLPPLDRTVEITGRFDVSFLIEKDGSIGNMCPLVHADHPWTVALIQYLGTMPAWSPGKIGGVSVRTRFNLPMHICLRD